ncbi:MAG: 23S rRNA (adenine(2030)-N(6))-methyltransferase RlmJ [Zoogloeaceae bacterium]|jgi:23S rRNA (adenine2030-N6)-methyltransferase|nr:23S rRNA (adenine(2030)-N(6))-methyltransferase RlmJ [Zoogloeaceae bacterium]
MLSYRHGFHAGNHADVLKHLTLVQILAHLTQKPTPLRVIDTHAGAGRYRLDTETAQKLNEHQNGIVRLWKERKTSGLPSAVRAYLTLVAALNGNGETLAHYPGSPWFARHLLRPQDRLHLFELHGNEFRNLARNFQGAGRTVALSPEDGLSHLKALLPPPSRRGLILLDPSYETASDYARLPESVRDALKRFPTGICMVWLPLLARREARQLPERLKRLAPDWLYASLQVRAAPSDGIGLYGSALWIANPPWTLAGTLAETLPWLAHHLAQDATATGRVETSTFSCAHPASSC